MWSFTRLNSAINLGRLKQPKHRRLYCAQEFSAEPRSKKRRLCQYHGPEPSVEEIEGEFWRILETPDEVRTVCFSVMGSHYRPPPHTDAAVTVLRLCSICAQLL